LKGKEAEKNLLEETEKDSIFNMEMQRTTTCTNFIICVG
jgi:hypothetical protein